MAVKKVIRYPHPVTGVETEAEYWFALGKTDLVEMDLAHMDNPGEYLQELIDNNDSRRMLDLWKEMLFHSVGVLVDGDTIEKGPHVVRKFQGSGAYEAFFGELVEMPDAGFSFFISIMPADVQAKVAQDEQQKREYTDQELLDMPEDEFRRIAGPNEANWDRRFLMLGMRRKTMPSKAA